MTDLSKFKTKDELLSFLVENKQLLISEKKYRMKEADAVSYYVPVYDAKDDAIKADATPEQLLAKDKLKIKVVINTTNLMDSHDDVHLKGIWKKTLKETKDVMLIQEHDMRFEKIISSDVKAKTETISWSALGYNFKGDTEALVFAATIDKSRNPFMFEQYAKGYVKNHSVGMRYVNLLLAVNSDNYKEEKEIWDKYIDDVVNRKDAEERGYFWAVSEAKLVEGSAVVRGSNYATPTISVKEEENEPSEDTQTDKDDSRQSDTIDKNEFIKLFTKQIKENYHD